MSGLNNILVDTNLIILSLAGDNNLQEVLSGNTIFISLITEIELQSIPFKSKKDEVLMSDFIANCFIIELDSKVKMQTIALRKSSKIRLPDAVIAASSIVHKIPLFTADKGFAKISSLDVVIF